MAEIHVEKKKSHWLWIVAAIIALLLIWALVAINDRDADDVAVAPAETSVVDPVGPVDATPGLTADVGATTGEASAVAILPVAGILAGPAAFVGREISGTATVTDVPTDRGFWIEQDGQRMFAVIEKGPNMEDAININTGQEIRFSDATVHDASSLAQLGGALDDEAKRLLSDQKAFLVVDPNDITVVSR